MTGMTERNRQKVELAGKGYSSSYINDWSAKTTLYRHNPSHNQDGEVVAEIGTAVSGVPGNPDYVLRKSKIGLLAWPPSDTCGCKWCVERASKPVEEEAIAAEAFFKRSAAVKDSVPS